MFKKIMSIFKTKTISLCDIEMCVNNTENTFFSRNGALVTYFNINNVDKIEALPEEVIQQTIGLIDKNFKDRGIQLEFVLTRNPNKDVICSTKSNPQKSELLKKRIKHLNNHSVSEVNLLILKSLPLNSENKPYNDFESLLIKHKENINNIKKIFSLLNGITVLDQAAALKKVYTEINLKDDDFWKPIFIGERANKKQSENIDKIALSNFDLSEQLYISKPSEIEDDNETVFYRENYYSTLIFEKMQSISSNIDNLISEAPKIPWRINICLNSGSNSIKKAIFNEKTNSSLIAFSEASEEINKSCNNLINLFTNNNVFSAQISATTWSSDYQRTIKNKNELSKAIQNWNGCHITDRYTDILELWASNYPGMASNRTEPPLVCTTSEVTRTLPLGRIGSPPNYDNTRNYFFTSEYNIYDQYYDENQKGIELIIGDKDSGKTKISSYLTANDIFNKNKDSKLIISLCPTYSSTYQYFNNLNVCESNTFKKIKVNNNFGLNVLEKNIYNEESDDKIKSIAYIFNSLIFHFNEYDNFDFCLECIKELFLKNKSEPKPYIKNLEPEVDKYVESSGEIFNTWEQINKYLISNSEQRLLKNSNKRASPDLDDLKDILTSPIINEKFSDRYMGELTVIEYANSKIKELERDFSVLFNGSKPEISNETTTIIELHEINDGTIISKKITSLAYYYILNVITDKEEISKDGLNKNSDYKCLPYKNLILDNLSLIPIHTEMFNDISGRIDNLSNTIRTRVILNTSNHKLPFRNIRSTYITANEKSKDTDNNLEHLNITKNEKKQFLDYIRTPCSNGIKLMYAEGGKLVNLFCQFSAYESWVYQKKKNNILLRSELFNIMDADKTMSILESEFPNGCADNYIISFISRNKDDDKPIKSIAMSLKNKYI